MQLTQHMCINTSLTTQLAMQLQQSMLQSSATTSNTPVNTSIPGYNYSPRNSPDAPQYHNMNGQQHSTMHSMSYDLNKQGSAQNYSVGHEVRTPYFGPGQPWQPVQHIPVTKSVQYTPVMQPAQHAPTMQPVEHTPIMQQSQAYGQFRTKESWQQIQPTRFSTVTNYSTIE